ncbi:MAG: sensor histidine kinase [Butyricicoccus sp.]
MGKHFHKLRSVRLKFFAAIAAVALVFITVISCLNLFFYEHYYMAQRQNSLRDIYSRVCQSYYTNNNEALQETLFRIENSDSVRISILDAAGAMIYDSDAARNGGSSPNFFTSWKTAQLVHSALMSADRRKFEMGHVDFVVVQMNDLRENFLCLVGRLGDGYLVERIPFAFMEQNSMFNSTFLLIAGAVTLVICLILGAILASHFTKPLIEMGSIAKSMAHLDFSQKYEGDEVDEIGQLGQSLNLLSDHLRDAIDDLRTSNEQLAHEIEEKERIDAMRREFIVNVSHELKTPIALIQGYAEGLTAGVAESPEDREFYCNTIAEEAGRMNTMVTQLLSLSKLELGREILSCEPISLGDCLREAVEKTAVLRAGHHLQVSCSGDAVIESDGRLLEQIIMNYMTNAIRYTPDGGSIALCVKQTEPDMVTISVFNEGEGVPEEELPLLWEKFYRTDKARSRASGGTGVGLSIVRASAALLGGHCEAKNVTGGIVFSVTLPVGVPAHIKIQEN